MANGHFESTRIWYFPNKVPIGSMYGRFTMIYLFYLHLVDFVVNVDKYTIHGSYGIRLAFPAVFFHTLLPQNKYGTLKKNMMVGDWKRTFRRTQRFIGVVCRCSFSSFFCLGFPKKQQKSTTGPEALIFQKPFNIT